MIVSEIKRIIDENYAKAKKILKEKFDLIENMSNLLLEKETIYQKEVDEIMAGKDYKEIIKRIDKEEKARKKKFEKAKLEQEREHSLKMQVLKEQAAEALSNAGVISKEEFEKIKEQTKQMKEEFAKTETDNVKKSTKKVESEKQVKDNKSNSAEKPVEKEKSEKSEEKQEKVDKKTKK